MADFIRLTKNGFVAFEWDSDLKQTVPVLKEASNIINLRSRCEIEDGVTLGDFFRAVQADPDLLEFISLYSWCGSLEEFHSQAQLPRIPAKPDDETELVSVILEPFGELYTDRRKPEALPEFHGVSQHFSGIGKDGIHYSISCTPMNQLAHLPLKLSTTLVFSKDFKENFSAEYSFSLLEVLDGIYWDISFYGGPSDNEAFVESLKEMMDEIESGKATTTPFITEGLLPEDD